MGPSSHLDRRLDEASAQVSARARQLDRGRRLETAGSLPEMVLRSARLLDEASAARSRVSAQALTRSGASAQASAPDRDRSVPRRPRSDGEVTGGLLLHEARM